MITEPEVSEHRPIRGRDDLVREVVQTVAAGSARVVTLTGLPGVGKTVVARRAAAQFPTRSSTGRAAIWIDVSSVLSADPPDGGSAVREAIAMSAGVTGWTGRTDDLGVALDATHHLVVLDQAGHDEVVRRVVTDLVQSSTSVRLLVTARRSLRLRGEQVIRVPPLAEPNADLAPRRLAGEPAVALFRDVAVASGGWSATCDEEIRDVARICALVGRLPLAIELIAARTTAFTPSAIRARLDEPESHTALIRAAAGADRLFAALEWSESLLTQEQHDIIGALTVFVGPVPAEAIESVVGRDVVAGLTDLVDAHLVDVEQASAINRYSLPPLVGEHARSRLTDAKVEALRDAHLVWALTVAAGMAAGETGAPDPMIATIEPDLVVAARRALRSGRPESAAKLVLAVAPWWLGRGVRDADIELIQAVRDGVGNGEPEAGGFLRALLCGWHANLLADRVLSAGDVEIVERLAGESFALARDSDPATRLRVLALTVRTARVAVDSSELTERCSEGHRLALDLGEQGAAAQFEIWAGMLAHVAGDVPAAAVWGSRALARSRRHNEEALMVAAAGLLRTLPPGTEVEVAVPSALELADIARRCGDRRTLSWVMPAAASEAIDAGQIGLAAELTLESLELLRAAGNWVWQLVPPIVNAALIAEQRGELAAAARLHGVVQPQLDTLRPHMAPGMLVRVERSSARILRAIGPDDFQRALAAGSIMRFDTAADEAVELLEAVLAGSGDDAGSLLSPREDEVLQRLAAGDSNKEIAVRLGIRPKTVTHHTSSIYRKLGVRGRGEAAAWFFRRSGADGPGGSGEW